MKMSGSHRISAPPQQVWKALNDPEILKASIPGCQALERIGENSFTATLTAKVGPIKVKFQGDVNLTDINPPHSYTIIGEGRGGTAGFAKGMATVTLKKEAADTILMYSVDAKLGGKLAQLGSRLIDSVAKKEADAFFKAFAEHAVNHQNTSDVQDAANSDVKKQNKPTAQCLLLGMLVAGAVILAALAYVLIK
jgi:hypothetical protein